MRCNYGSIIIIVIFTFLGCKKDDGVETVPVRDVGEVAVENDGEIVAYLESHFYNYEEFANPAADFNYQIVFDTIAGTNADKTPLIDQVEVKTVTVSDVDHKLYYLIARQGSGELTRSTDSTLVRFRGTLLDETIFDISNVPVWFDVIFNIRGFWEFTKELKKGTGYVQNADGTLTFNNDYSIGAVFMPSGLGYFASGKGVIPAYAPLVFSIDMLDSKMIDHDGDGIYSYLEDLDGDGNPFNDNTDGDANPNFTDSNDDNDNVLTRYEIIINEDGTVEFPDCDGNGVPDYLDKKLCL